MKRQLTIREATSVARAINRIAHRLGNPPGFDWNDRINDRLLNIGLGFRLKESTFIDGLDCQFVKNLARTIRLNSEEING